jgi:hypothetical protein
MNLTDIITLVIGASVLVLLVKNPNGSASLINSGGGFIQGETKILTGTGYTGGN